MDLKIETKIIKIESGDVKTYNKQDLYSKFYLLNNLS